MSKTIAIQVLKDMISQRGFEISSEDENKIISKRNDETLIVFTNIINKINIEKVKEIINTLYKLAISNCIIIYSENITSMALKLIENSLELHIELFTLDELQFNITKHVLVPMHEKITDEESVEFKKKYGVKFPILLKSDPVCKFYNFKKGDIIKIHRKDFIAYRIVK